MTINIIATRFTVRKKGVIKLMDSASTARTYKQMPHTMRHSSRSVSFGKSCNHLMPRSKEKNLKRTICSTAVNLLPVRVVHTVVMVDADPPMVVLAQSVWLKAWLITTDLVISFRAMDV